MAIFTKKKNYNLIRRDNVKSKVFLIRAEFTGLTAGIGNDLTLIFEKENFPGGLCASYYTDFKNINGGLRT